MEKKERPLNGVMFYCCCCFCSTNSSLRSSTSERAVTSFFPSRLDCILDCVIVLFTTKFCAREGAAHIKRKGGKTSCYDLTVSAWPVSLNSHKDRYNAKRNRDPEAQLAAPEHRSRSQSKSLPRFATVHAHPPALPRSPMLSLHLFCSSYC